jgi:hypothetical protein
MKGYGAISSLDVLGFGLKLRKGVRIEEKAVNPLDSHPPPPYGKKVLPNFGVDAS